MRCARPKRLSCPLRLQCVGFEGDVFVSREANGLAPTCSRWPATPHKAEQSRSWRHLQNTYARCPLGKFRLRRRQPLSKTLDQKTLDGEKAAGIAATSSVVLQAENH